MNIIELKKAIDTNSLNNLMIFYGPEHKILDIYIDKIRKLFTKTYVAESLSNVYMKLVGASLLSTGRALYVIRDDKTAFTAESMWEDIEQKLKKHDVFIVLKYETIDNRSKFAKRFADNCVIFDTLSESVLRKYIAKDITIADKDAEFLITKASKDYGRISFEVDKVKRYAEECGITDKESFRECRDSGAFYTGADGDIFELINSIMRRDCRAIQYNLIQSRLRGDNALAILSLLHTNIKALLQVQLLQGYRDMSQVSGLSGFQIKNASQYTGRYSTNELIRFIKLIKFCDKSIKDGSLNSDIAVDYLLVHVVGR